MNESPCCVTYTHAMGMKIVDSVAANHIMYFFESIAVAEYDAFFLFLLFSCSFVLTRVDRNGALFNESLILRTEVFISLEELPA